MPRRARQDQDADPPPFEEAMDQLEQIVRRMEDDELALEELVGEYERGVRLLNLCKERLDDARGRVEAIKEGAGANAAVPGTADPGAGQMVAASGTIPGLGAGEADDDEGQQEIRLF